MKQQVLLLLAIALVATVEGRSHFFKHVLDTNSISARTVKKNFKECEEFCKKNFHCIALSFDRSTGDCYVAQCGTVEIKKNKNFLTVFCGNPTTFGIDLPRTLHNFPITERCGLHSLGSNQASSIVANGLDFKHVHSQVYGNALHFSNHKNAYTWEDPSLAVYAQKETSFTVAMMVYFEKTPANACLFEFHNDGRCSWHYWLWPNPTSVYQNAVTGAFVSQFLYVQNTFSAQQWTHYAFSYDAMSGRQDTYVNGKKILSAYLSYAAKATIKAFTIGGRFNDNLGFYDGSTYCLSLFDKPLNEFQVNEHKRSCKKGQVHIVCDKNCH